MADQKLQVKRYPNRRFYARHVKKYVSLEDIECWIREGHRVEIVDSQSGEDLTRSVLTQLLIERHPDKVALFPAELLHFMLRANSLMADFLRNYFRDSLTYLEYLQSPGRSAPLVQPFHWMRAWFESGAARPEFASGEPPAESTETSEPDAAPEAASATPPTDRERQLATRVAELEERIRRLESRSAD